MTNASFIITVHIMHWNVNSLSSPVILWLITLFEEQTFTVKHILKYMQCQNFADK